MNGSTALHLASRGGHLEVCRAITSSLSKERRGGLLEERDAKGSTALYIAADQGRHLTLTLTLILNLIRNLTRNLTLTLTLTLTVDQGHGEVVSHLLAQGAEGGEAVSYY